MECPNCALYHPARYDRCVSCGTKLVSNAGGTQQAAPNSPAPATDESVGTSAGTKKSYRQSTLRYDSDATDQNEAADIADDTEARPAGTLRTSTAKGKSGIPTAVGIIAAGVILCASAGITFFFLTKPPENERLFQDGQKQLNSGQYAFALKTLTEAAKLKPNDSRVMLSLARAYVGVDQVDKAWECITQAQQLGAGVVADPGLASDSANYYRQHNQYQRAIELLRPLATQDVPGKKAELSDLDAAWGDEALRTADVKQALRCWEEVRDLKEGSRLNEAESRLASIYQKIAEEAATKNNYPEALQYYGKLNAMAPSAAAYERTAELCRKQGNLELAIDQLNQALKLAADPSSVNPKLAALMSARGKELIDKGDTDAGYGYLQKAHSLDGRDVVPSATIRGAHLNIDQPTGLVHFSADVWNPGPNSLGSITARAELYDTKSATTLWTKDERVVDEFMPPLPVHETRHFEISSTGPAPDPTSTEFRIYLNNSLYKSYPLSDRANTAAGLTSTGVKQTAGEPQLAPRLQLTDTDKTPPLAPNVVPGMAPRTQPGAATPGTATGPSSEEKTMKDLE